MTFKFTDDCRKQLRNVTELPEAVVVELERALADEVMVLNLRRQRHADVLPAKQKRRKITKVKNLTDNLIYELSLLKQVREAEPFYAACSGLLDVDFKQLLESLSTLASVLEKIPEEFDSAGATKLDQVELVQQVAYILVRNGIELRPKGTLFPNILSAVFDSLNEKQESIPRLIELAWPLISVRIGFPGEEISEDFIPE